MITKMTQWDFVNDFKAIRPDNFSNEGLLALFEYLEEFEIDTGEILEFDPIAICCDFSEHESALEAARLYDPEGWGAMTETDAEESALQYLQDRTLTLQLQSGRVIIQDL